MDSVSFDSMADKYNQTRSFPQAVMSDILKSLSCEFPSIKEMTIIDIGVGTGRFAIPLSTIAKSIVGIDISQKMLDVLMSNNTSKNLTTICCNAENIMFPNDSFDMAFAVSVFHLIPNWKKVLDEIERVLKTDGLCIIGRTEYVGAEGIQYEYIRHKVLRKYSKDAQERGLPFDQQLIEFNNRWKLLKKITAATWENSYIPSEILKSFEEKHWSETWNISDFEFHYINEEIRREIQCSGIEMNRKYLYRCSFVFYAYSVNALDF